MTQSQLPAAWVDKIFAKLTLVYGRGFLSQYEGIDIRLVKDDWAHELSGFLDKPDYIAYGLQNLPPDKAPNVLAFRALCRRMPEPVYKALPAPKADAERVRAEIAKLKKILTSPLHQRSNNDEKPS